MTVIDRIRAANRPGAPEHSIALRVAATTTVLVGVAACHAEGALSENASLIGSTLVVVGMAFSYVTRSRPPGYTKVAAAVAAVSLLAWFVNALSGGHITDITTVEDPLTILFLGIQSVHSFHVPSRRDLMFTLAGGTGLMALAAAQAIDVNFAVYVVAWFLLTLWALVEMWRSASGGARVSIRGTGTAVGGVCVGTIVVFLLLPAPSVSVRIDFSSNPGSGGPVPVPGALAGDAGSVSQLSRPGTPGGRSRVGGYLGFANRLDTALRGGLGKTLVMRVRAQRPSYWIGQTYDRWDGQSWLSTIKASNRLQDGSPFFLPMPAGDIPSGQADLQTFYIASSSANLVFHADRAQQVWFPASQLFSGADGTIISPIGLGKGAIYTVESYVSAASPDQLRSTSGIAGDNVPDGNGYTALPYAYPRAGALARSVTAGATNTYDKIQSLINWIGSHTKYSTAIPPLPRGADTVNEFLFGNRVGFCEQISTSLAVMLRSLGIPAREAVGYVPGGYNPVTDLYDVRAEDAHAWVQVWFPGYGWQSFDPTASVPLANPSPGATALKDVGHALARIPVAPAGTALGGAGLAVVAARWRRSRPRTWDAQVLREMERAGSRCRRPRRGSETLFEYATVLDHLAPGGEDCWQTLAMNVASAAYGSRPPPEALQTRMASDARKLRRITTRGRHRARSEGGQSLVGLAVLLLVLGGIGAVVAVSVSGSSTPRLPTIGSTGPQSSARSGVQGDISAAEVAACTATYATAEQAFTAYQAENGHPPQVITDLKPFVRDPLDGPGFTLYVQGGQLAVATPGHPAKPGPANCSFAGA